MMVIVGASTRHSTDTALFEEVLWQPTETELDEQNAIKTEASKDEGALNARGTN